MKYCFGIDIGGTTVKMGLFQEDGELLDKWETPESSWSTAAVWLHLPFCPYKPVRSTPDRGCSADSRTPCP